MIKHCTSIIRIDSRPSFSLTSVRHSGGGGGRPGGKPTFNFKEKRILGIDKPYEKLKLRPHGFFEDIEKHFDPKRGDVMINLDDYKTWTDEFDLKPNNTRKQVQMSALFGPNKGYGMHVIPKKGNRKVRSSPASPQ